MAKKSSIRRIFKARESRICHIFSIPKRVPLTGEESCDCLSDEWAIEVFTKIHPKYMRDEHAQAEKAALKKGKGCIPITVWCQKSKPDDQAFVYMRLKDFIDNFV